MRGATSAVTTLPAATNASRPDRHPGQDGGARPHEGAPLEAHGCRSGGKGRLERMVGVAHVQVGEHQHALRERDLVLELDALGQVEQALVAQEALVARSEAGEARGDRG